SNDNKNVIKIKSAFAIFRICFSKEDYTITKPDEYRAMKTFYINNYIDLTYDHVQSMSKRSFIVFIILPLLSGLICFNSIYCYPLPSKFPNPYKYRLISTYFLLSRTFAYYLSYLSSFLMDKDYELGEYYFLRLFYNFLFSCNGLKHRDQLDGLSIKDHTINNYRLRLYDFPRFMHGKQENRTIGFPLIIYLRGGSFILGNLDTHDSIAYNLAKTTRIAVLALDYNLAPEQAYPTQINYCYDFIKQLLLGSYFNPVDRSKILLIGDEVGATMVLSIVQRLQAEDLRIAGQILIYPILQYYNMKLPSHNRYFSENILGLYDQYFLQLMLHAYTNLNVTSSLFMNEHHSRLSRLMKEYSYMNNYVNEDYLPEDYRQQSQNDSKNDNVDRTTIISPSSYNEQLVNEYALLLLSDLSPGLSTDDMLKTMPPTFILTMDHDPFRDDGWILSRRLYLLHCSIHHLNYNLGFRGILQFDGYLRFDLMPVVYLNIVEFITAIGF
ncbi:unnamed protein product, partial [Didymodactylos carnosus]